MQAPPIDKRDYPALVAETTELARTYSGWQPPAAGAPDAGQALIHIFGRFAELVVQRINRAPEKNYLAFLNLIGTNLLPPQPARVPLTFALAESSPVEAVVPAGTQVAAPPLEGEEDEVVFETERNLVVTRAQLQAVFVSDPETDTYSDRTQEATGKLDAPFAAFNGHQPVPHELYVACDAVLAQPGAKNVTLVLQSPDNAQWTTWKFAWAYWDGANWQAIVPATAAVAGGAWQVSFSKLPELMKTVVNGTEAGWLRVQLKTALSPGANNLAPDSMVIGTRRPEDFATPLGPFGDAVGNAAVKFFYLSADEALGSGGARARLKVGLARAGVGANVKINWSYKVGSEWRPLGSSSAKAALVGTSDFGLSDGTQALTRAGEIIFNVPETWPATFFRSRMGRWLRAEVTDDGAYTTLPQLNTLTVSYGWDLPRLTGVTVQLNDPPAGQAAPNAPPESAFFNSGVVDLTKDFYPFGEQPRFNDTLYLALPDAQAQPGSVVTLQVEVTDPSKVNVDAVKKAYGEGRPRIVWEVSSGTVWREVGRFDFVAPPPPARKPGQTPFDETNVFTANGAITLTLPASIAPTTVNNEERIWLRARLVSGDYGKAAKYEEQGTTYKLIAATYAPPSIKSISYKPVSTRSTTATTAGTTANRQPVLCFSHNNFVYQDLLPSLAKAQATTPFVATSDPDPALYLGFNLPFEPRLISLYLQVEPPLPEEVAADTLAELDPTSLAQVVWEYAHPSSPSSWQPLGALDETQTLSDRGLVQFFGPQAIAQRAYFGQNLFWVRLRWQRGYFPLPPRLRRVLPNSMWASQVTSITDEILGSSNGNPNQMFVAAQQPVQPGQRVLVREREHLAAEEAKALVAIEGQDAITITHDAADQPDEIWVRWHAVPDFYHSGLRDRHYTADALTGEIRFGDGQLGLIPPQGQNNIRASYRTGGGEQGNRAAQTIVQLKSGVPYIDSVTNYESAQGGAPREPLERLKARGSRILRHQDRVIAAQDLEDLAYEASTEVARVAAVVPNFDPSTLWLEPQAKPGDPHNQVDAGRMGVIVVPNSAAARPTPSLGLVRQVQAYLLARCPPTADVWVAGPEWVRVTVRTNVVPVVLDEADAVVERVRTTLARYLHPLLGGPKGEGWAFGRKPHRSDLFALVEAVPGVDHVRMLEVTHQPEAEDANFVLDVQHMLDQKLSSKQQPEPQLMRWLNRALVYSGPHEIIAEMS